MVRRIALCIAILAAACGDEVGSQTPQPGEVPGERGQVVDQSGAAFGWQCDEQRCRVENIDEPVPECGPPSKAVYTYSWGYFIEITAACADSEGWGALPHWGRYVVCEADEDCPVIRSNGSETLHVCDAGFCKNAEHAEYFAEMPNKWMMISLCIGDAPRELYGEDPSDAIMADIDAACPGEDINSPCHAFPKGCPDPRG